MFDYQICNVYDKNIFQKQCTAIEKHIPDLDKESLLEDVDGSQIQVYIFRDNKKIKVINDVIFGISVEAEFNLEEYFD